MPSPHTGQLTADWLIEVGIFEEVDDGGVQLNPEFATQVAELEDELSSLRSAQIVERLRSVGGSRPEAESLISVVGDDLELLALHLAVSEVDEIREGNRLRVTSLLDSVSSNEPPTYGVPEGFVPVSPDRLPFHVWVYEKAIVYLWREDCPPCDEIRSQLPETIGSGIDGLALLAAYGPDADDLLADRYQAVVAPTILFFLRGQVESRLVGGKPTSVIERHVELLREA